MYTAEGATVNLGQGSKNAIWRIISKGLSENIVIWETVTLEIDCHPLPQKI